MSSFKVTVLCPSGHRVTAKLDSRDSPVLDILRHVCNKRDLDIKAHKLKHHNTILDNTISIRYANLPQNANLELIETEPENTTDKPVKLGVQMEGAPGRKVLEVASDNITLAEVLVKAGGGSPPPDSEPVMIYLRREVTDLKGTTLRDLGIVSGGAPAALRVVFREPGSTGSKEQAHVGAVSIAPSASEKKREAAWRPMKAEPDMTLTKIIGGEKKGNSSSVEESMDQRVPSEKIHGNTEFEEAISKSEQRPEETAGANSNVKARDRSPEAEMAEEPAASGAPAAKSDPEPAVLHYLEGGMVAYDRAEAGANAALSQLSDDFFDMTIDDVKLLHREARDLVKEMNEGGHLMTKEMRETQKEGQKLAALNKYKKCLVRMNFAQDSIVLQGVFSPAQTLSQVQSSLKPFLLDPDTTKIKLYTTPPKTVLDPGVTLLEANCVPAILLHVESTSTAGKGKLLKPDLALSNASGVEQAVRNSGVIRVKKADTATAAGTSSSGPSTASGVKRPSESELKKLPDDKKMPKWLSKGKQ